MGRIVWMLAALAAPIATEAAWHRAAPRANADLGAAAVELAKQLGEGLAKHAPPAGGKKFRVGVFPFGNYEGRYSLEMGDNGPVLRECLVEELKKYLDKKAPGRFAVLYPDQLDEEIQASSTDPTGVSRSLAVSRKLLQAFDLQAGVVGRFGVRKLSTLLNAQEETIRGKPDPYTGALSVKIEARAVLPSAAVNAASDVMPYDMNRLSFTSAHVSVKEQRLGVRFFAKTDDRAADDSKAWTAIPLQVSVNAQKEGLYYLVVPKAYKGKRYKIVLVNRGKPRVDTDNNPKDPDRLFSAAVLVDGMSTFMKRDGNAYRHVSGHPNAQPKWIIAPVGKRLVADKAGYDGRIEGGKLIAANGPGGAQVHVHGFQKGGGKAGAFVFADAASSVAAPELLALRKIGAISVYFWAEKLPQIEHLDSPAPTGGTGGLSAGTKMGEDVRSATFRVRVLNWNDYPFAVHHIVYRYEGDPDLPRALKQVENAD